MKKRISFLIFLIFLIFFILSFSHIKAQEQPTDARQVLAKEFNVSLDKVPQNQSDLQRFILAKEWENRIANGSWTGWIHLGFSSTTGQYVFLIIFAHKYEISLTFLMIFILWILVWFWTAQSIEIAHVKPIKAVLYGALGAIALAQLHVIDFVSTSFINYIWGIQFVWGMVISIIVGIGIAAFITVAIKIAKKASEKKSAEKVKAEGKQAVNEIKEFKEGLDQGQRMARK